MAESEFEARLSASREPAFYPSAVQPPLQANGVTPGVLAKVSENVSA